MKTHKSQLVKHMQLTNFKKGQWIAFVIYSAEGMPQHYNLASQDAWIHKEKYVYLQFILVITVIMQP